ncbi:DNA-directed RNA polymerase II subunit RPB7 isoform X2 [Fagus crenata]
MWRAPAVVDIVFVVAITGIDNVGKGLIRDETGFVTFPVKYQCVVKIQKDSEARLKIIGTRVDATEIFCIGTIKDDFLGVKNDPTA